MTTPKELADRLTEAFVNEEAVEQAMKVFAAANRELAEELRKLAQEKVTEAHHATKDGLVYLACANQGEAEAFSQAAQMVEERLNGS